MKKQDLINTINDKSLTTKERGDALEEFIKDYIEFESPWSIKKTKGSGALHGDGDLHVEHKLCIDGKVHGKCTSVSIKQTELQKVLEQAAKLDMIGTIATPLVKDDKVDIFITLRLEDLIDIVAALSKE